MAIEIKALTPDLEEDYFDFFDHRAFSDGSPYYPCYCNAFNMSIAEINAMQEEAQRNGTGRRPLRSFAVRDITSITSLNR